VDVGTGEELTGPVEKEDVNPRLTRNNLLFSNGCAIDETDNNCFIRAR
jgi:hypothetical protein